MHQCLEHCNKVRIDFVKMTVEALKHNNKEIMKSERLFLPRKVEVGVRGLPNFRALYRIIIFLHTSSPSLLVAFSIPVCLIAYNIYM